MKNNKLLMLLVFIMLFFVSACTPTTGKKVVGIEGDIDTFKKVVTIDEFDIRTWYIQVNYSDDTYELVKVSLNMLSTEDTQKLSKVGEHELTFNYQKFSFVHKLTINGKSEEYLQSKLDQAISEITVPDAVEGSFNLSTLSTDGVSISWSSDSEYVNITRGFVGVTAPSAELGDQVITITATFKIEHLTSTVDYTVILKAQVEEEVPPMEGNYEGDYYNTCDLTKEGRSLLLELRELITDTHDVYTTYASLRQHIGKTDALLDNSSLVMTLYARLEVQAAWSTNGTIWNREHVWPQSVGWSDTTTAGSDLHHIRPTDPSVNSARGNTPFGKVVSGSEVKTKNGTPSGCYKGGGYFEPQDAAKGDCARIIFYLLTRYEDADKKSITVVAQSMELLLEWHELDPVDEWEIRRNEETAKIQGNRNPFIDYPDLAEAIWGAK